MAGASPWRCLVLATQSPCRGDLKAAAASVPVGRSHFPVTWASALAHPSCLLGWWSSVQGREGSQSPLEECCLCPGPGRCPALEEAPAGFSPVNRQLCLLPVLSSSFS